MASPAIEERRHVLNVNVARGLVVDGDAARLSQVVANLLTNAAKYTDPGGRIEVSGTVQDLMAVVRVTDSGRGISPEMLPRDFRHVLAGTAGDRPVGGRPRPRPGDRAEPGAGARRLGQRRQRRQGARLPVHDPPAARGRR